MRLSPIRYEPTIPVFPVVLLSVTVVLIVLEIPFGFAPKNLDAVPTVEQRVRILGYEREQFGNGWVATLSGRCDTRRQALAQQFGGGSCYDPDQLLVGIDPYTGEEISTNDPIEVDHIFPLRAAWDLGAHAWSRERRIEFANDPLNLVAVSKAANQKKSDHLPSRWVPENTKIHCEYFNRLVDICLKYQLPLPKEDVAVMRKARCVG